MQNVMKKAWEIAKEGQNKFGGKVKEYFAEALKIAWSIVKKGMNYVNQVKGTIAKMNALKLEGTEKQVSWAEQIRRKAAATLQKEVIYEEYEEVSLLPNRKPTTQKRNVGNLLQVLASEEGINAHFAKMEADGLPKSRIETTIQTMNNLIGRYERLSEIMQNTDAKFWIDNRDNQAKNYMFGAFKKYVNTGVKEF